jgi:P27 family predicted phage terminase small subunit
MSSSTTPLQGAMPPDGMSPEAKAKWHQLLPRLEALNFAEHEHLDQLAVFCEAFATWHEATLRIRAHGHLARVGKSVFQSPWIGIRDGAAAQMRDLATRLGFAPDARLTARLPTFSEYAEMAGAEAGIDGDGYQIVHADGTVEILHD